MAKANKSMGFDNIPETVKSTITVTDTAITITLPRSDVKSISTDKNGTQWLHFGSFYKAITTAYKDKTMIAMVGIGLAEPKAVAAKPAAKAVTF